MSEIIPSITFSQLKKLNASQIRRLKCCEITSDGAYVGTFINGNIESSGYLRTQSEYNGQTANAVGGETLEEILKEEVAV